MDTHYKDKTVILSLLCEFISILVRQDLYIETALGSLQLLPFSWQHSSQEIRKLFNVYPIKYGRCFFVKYEIGAKIVYQIDPLALNYGNSIANALESLQTVNDLLTISDMLRMFMYCLEW